MLVGIQWIVEALAVAFSEAPVVTAHECDTLALELLGIGVSASFECIGLRMIG